MADHINKLLKQVLDFKKTEKKYKSDYENYHNKQISSTKNSKNERLSKLESKLIEQKNKVKQNSDKIIQLQNDDILKNDTQDDLYEDAYNTQNEQLIDLINITTDDFVKQNLIKEIIKELDKKIKQENNGIHDNDYDFHNHNHENNQNSNGELEYSLKEKHKFKLDLSKINQNLKIFDENDNKKLPSSSRFKTDPVTEYDSNTIINQKYNQLNSEYVTKNDDQDSNILENLVYGNLFTYEQIIDAIEYIQNQKNQDNLNNDKIKIIIGLYTNEKEYREKQLQLIKCKIYNKLQIKYIKMFLKNFENLNDENKEIDFEQLSSDENIDYYKLQILFIIQYNYSYINNKEQDLIYNLIQQLDTDEDDLNVKKCFENLCIINQDLSNLKNNKQKKQNQIHYEKICNQLNINIKNKLFAKLFDYQYYFMTQIFVNSKEEYIKNLQYSLEFIYSEMITQQQQYVLKDITLTKEKSILQSDKIKNIQNFIFKQHQIVEKSVINFLKLKLISQLDQDYSNQNNWSDIPYTSNLVDEIISFLDLIIGIDSNQSTQMVYSKLKQSIKLLTEKFHKDFTKNQLSSIFNKQINDQKYDYSQQFCILINDLNQLDENIQEQISNIIVEQDINDQIQNSSIKEYNENSIKSNHIFDPVIEEPEELNFMKNITFEQMSNLHSEFSISTAEYIDNCLLNLVQICYQGELQIQLNKQILSDQTKDKNFFKDSNQKGTLQFIHTMNEQFKTWFKCIKYKYLQKKIIHKCIHQQINWQFKKVIVEFYYSQRNESPKKQIPNIKNLKYINYDLDKAIESIESKENKKKDKLQSNPDLLNPQPYHRQENKKIFNDSINIDFMIEQDFNYLKKWAESMEQSGFVAINSVILIINILEKLRFQKDKNSRKFKEFQEEIKMKINSLKHDLDIELLEMFIESLMISLLMDSKDLYIR